MDQPGKENGMEFQKGYAPVDDLSMYYEIHGSTRADRLPLVLIRGGGDTIQTSFGKLIPELARDRQVIAFEQRGFGHTAGGGAPS
jgi:pimeloyl-ACP methyl ester carboxylesterase